MLGVALVIGLARGISVVMTNGLIIDTILYWARALSAVWVVWLLSTSSLCFTCRWAS